MGSGIKKKGKKTSPHDHLTLDFSPPMPKGAGETANRALGGKQKMEKGGGGGGGVGDASLCVLQSGAERVRERKESSISRRRAPPGKM